jgi:hypothetical protein
MVDAINMKRSHYKFMATILNNAYSSVAAYAYSRRWHTNFRSDATLHVLQHMGLNSASIPLFVSTSLCIIPPSKMSFSFFG